MFKGMFYFTGFMYKSRTTREDELKYKFIKCLSADNCKSNLEFERNDAN